MINYFNEHLTFKQQNEICTSVAGSCDSGPDVDYWQKEFGFSDAVARALDLDFPELAAKFELFRCEDCCWWGDMGEIGQCNECDGELV